MCYNMKKGKLGIVDDDELFQFLKLYNCKILKVHCTSEKATQKFSRDSVDGNSALNVVCAGGSGLRLRTAQVAADPSRCMVVWIAMRCSANILPSSAVIITRAPNTSPSYLMLSSPWPNFCQHQSYLVLIILHTL